MPSLNQVTTKGCIWQNYIYYIMIIPLQIKVKNISQIFQTEKWFCLKKYSYAI